LLSYKDVTNGALLS